MKKITACAVVFFLALATDAVAAELVLKQWSVLLPERIAIPENFGTPIRERVGESDAARPPRVPMPLPAPGGKMTPSPAEATE